MRKAFLTKGFGILSAQTSKCFLKSTCKPVEPVAFPEREKDPLRGGRLQLAPQVGSDNPLQFPSRLVVHLNPVKLGVWAAKVIRQGVEVMLEDQASSVSKLIKLGVEGFIRLHLKENWRSKLESAKCGKVLS
jgi:hypothetical protein